MDMILCDARAYTINYIATRKRNDYAEKKETQQQLDNTVRLLELGTGQDPTTTHELLVKINTLKDTIQAMNDYEEQEKARK